MSGIPWALPALQLIRARWQRGPSGQALPSTCGRVLKIRQVIRYFWTPSVERMTCFSAVIARITTFLISFGVARILGILVLGTRVYGVTLCYV
jgi:hypothetical protein